MRTKYPLGAYIHYDLHGDCKDSPDIRCHEIKIVKTRKEHKCFFADPHDIPVGQLVRYEKALVDGEWGSVYVCLPCMDKYFDEWGA